ncbi:YolD-like family protein [Salsuginibacillus kocurii]|uniref:YolD-like family protein n=1 Tax=Salsuginibacillus kocurii TaxID=427078 RepID=UPI00036BA0F9|nr:YolD-like family protein [Salsuginibacillus kocurii]
MKENKLTPGTNLRWESMRMILPEHREMMLKRREEDKKSAPPSVDDQQWEEFGWTLEEALVETKPLEVTYWNGGYYVDVQGYCHYVNYNQKKLHVVTFKDEVEYLHFEFISDIKII